MPKFRYVHYEVIDAVAEITMDRPPVNAIDLELIEDVVTAMRQAGEDKKARAVILKSAHEKAFCAGLDLSVLKGATSLDMRKFLNKLYLELYDVQYRLGKPSIAAVRGATRAGGMTLAVSCDMIIGGHGASFGYPEVNVGLIPGLHFTHLPRIVGRHTAFELLFSGDQFSAEAAYEMGLLNKLVPDDEVIPEARRLARTFAEKSPIIMAIGRAAFMRANDLHYRRDIEHAAETMSALVETPDAREGLAAFVEKRPPKWQD
ncbi:MAG: enoyl-CoA hydratase/isomerase family protein [Deltaproteobacteria bacterium]|nr:enoyl-CoA hydratase/isomerase family protein [Deltaproteobacteria bacterium]